jgi:hypothetical protein
MITTFATLITPDIALDMQPKMPNPLEEEMRFPVPRTPGIPPIMHETIMRGWKARKK